MATEYDFQSDNAEQRAAHEEWFKQDANFRAARQVAEDNPQSSAAQWALDQARRAVDQAENNYFQTKEE